MERYLSDQAVAFLWAVILGGALGVLYDWFRIGRILRKKRWFTVFLEDLLFSLAAALATAACFTLTNHGQVRLFLLVGEGLGFVIYFYTLGVFVTWQARMVARFLQYIKGRISAFFGFLGKKLRKIMNFSKKPFIFLKRWFTIKMYHLKERKALREKESRRHSKERKSKKIGKNEPRRAGSFGRSFNLRRRKYDRNLHQTSSSDSGKESRAGRYSGKNIQPKRHQ